ncbi:hypothetical protein BD779DRAFT_1475808 [Infundibulicybe gibba]|nr:hypothetical protein BD779DRAFT_1475808 [Infundibulicybe gibba]
MSQRVTRATNKDKHPGLPDVDELTLIRPVPKRRRTKLEVAADNAASAQKKQEELKAKEAAVADELAGLQTIAAYEAKMLEDDGMSASRPRNKKITKVSRLQGGEDTDDFDDVSSGYIEWEIAQKEKAARDFEDWEEAMLDLETGAKQDDYTPKISALTDEDEHAPEIDELEEDEPVMSNRKGKVQTRPRLTIKGPQAIMPEVDEGGYAPEANASEEDEPEEDESEEDEPIMSKGMGKTQGKFAEVSSVQAGKRKADDMPAPKNTKKAKPAQLSGLIPGWTSSAPTKSRVSSKTSSAVVADDEGQPPLSQPGLRHKVPTAPLPRDTLKPLDDPHTNRIKFGGYINSDEEDLNETMATTAKAFNAGKLWGLGRPDQLASRGTIQTCGYIHCIHCTRRENPGEIQQCPLARWMPPPLAEGVIGSG